MKKFLIAVACAAACAGMDADAALAQSVTTLYGALGAGVTYANNSGPANKGVLRMDSGTLYGNRVGVRSSEDLGGGKQAIALVESGFALDNGASTQGSLLFGRQAYVGLQGDGIGTLTLGRQYTLDLELAPYHSYVAQRVNNFGGLSHWVDRLADRVNNAVRYVTPSYGGLRLGAMVGLGERSGNAAGGRTINAGVNYVNGGVGLGASYLRINTSDGARLTGVALATAQYRAGATTFHLAYSDTRGVGADTLCFSTCAARSGQWVRTYEAGIDYQFNPADRLYVGVAHTRLTRDLEGKALQFNLAAFHALSKQVEFYSLFGWTKTSGLGGFARAAAGTPDFGPTAFTSNPQGTADRGRQLAFRVGMTYKF